MTRLKDETVKYAYAQFPWEDDEHGFYFSDDAIDPFIKSVQKIVRGVFEEHVSLQDQISPINRHRILLPEFQLSIKQSHDLVIGALTSFDPSLGERTKRVISDDSRWKVGQTETGNAYGCCYPASSKQNDKPYAIIEYYYDGTINDPVYVAHEIGHLLADDAINKAGFSCYDSKYHMAELQAFFVQCILYDDLMKSSDFELAGSARNHYISEMSRGLYDLVIGVGALEADKVANNDVLHSSLSTVYGKVMNQWLGQSWTEYDKAAHLADNIEDPEYRDRKAIVNLHQHAMSSVMAAGLFEAAKQMSSEDRTDFIDTLMGLNGPQSINDILELAIDKSNLALNDIAKAAVHSISDPALAYMHFSDRGNDQAILESKLSRPSV